ncbi:protein of unknown function (plasmid) [Pararobbsia alpina]
MVLRDLQRLHEQFTHGPVTIEMTSAHPALTPPAVTSGHLSQRVRRSAIFAGSAVALVLVSAAAGIGAAHFGGWGHQSPAPVVPVPRIPTTPTARPASATVITAPEHAAAPANESGSPPVSAASPTAPQVSASGRQTPQLTFDSAALSNFASVPPAGREPAPASRPAQTGGAAFASPVRAPVLERVNARASENQQPAGGQSSTPPVASLDATARAEAPLPVVSSAPKKVAVQSAPGVTKHIANHASPSPAVAARDPNGHNAEAPADRAGAASAATEVNIF